MKKKLTNKLALKKETLGALTTNQLNEIKGGGTSNCAFSQVTYTGGTVCKCQ